MTGTHTAATGASTSGILSFALRPLRSPLRKVLAAAAFVAAAAHVPVIGPTWPRLRTWARCSSS